ncbi:hypothetical protein CYMTET_11380 [Cymbomonas tetramitiformis]|uniref:Uncharacterized protein n=1 Tax=Cymbomonas tetramitiformis TaxID=36881 RepID=A0AAE0LCW9_9CHLO|nr:hypothetical protein CYMTET_11380 [Cymbomonas tetramitiformis]
MLVSRLMSGAQAPPDTTRALPELHLCSMDEGVNVKARLGELRMRLGGIGGNKPAFPSTGAPDAIMDKDILPKGVKAAPPPAGATDSVDSLDEFRSRLGKFRTKQHEEVQQKPAKQRVHALNAATNEDIVARRDLLEYELRHVNELLERKVPNKPAPASYESMQTELREVRKELLHCKALNVELDHVKAEVQTQREKVKEKKDEDHVLKKGLKEAQAQSALKDTKLAKMQTELIKVKELSGKEAALLEKKVKEYERQVERVKQEEAHVERVLQQVKAESSDLASKLNEAKQQGAQAAKDQQELKQKLETVTAQSATVSHELQAVKQARDGAQTEPHLALVEAAGREVWHGTPWWRCGTSPAGGGVARHPLVEVWHVTGWWRCGTRWWRYDTSPAGGGVAVTGWWRCGTAPAGGGNGTSPAGGECGTSPAGGGVARHPLVEVWHGTGWWRCGTAPAGGGGTSPAGGGCVARHPLVEGWHGTGWWACGAAPPGESVARHRLVEVWHVTR